jgi:protein-tyrosine-phosphatase
VCDCAHEQLGTDPAADQEDRQRLHWAVPDPARTDTADAFESAYHQITARLDRLAAATQSRTPQPVEPPPP